MKPSTETSPAPAGPRVLSPSRPRRRLDLGSALIAREHRERS
jgi:hypothetical protein